MSAGGGTRAVVAALVANLGIALAKLVAFVFTRSGSMLAESIHSFADTSNQGLLLLGHRRSHHEPTALHQFGFGRERYFWSFIVSMILFSLGGAFAIYEGIEKIRHPHELESLQWAIGVLLFAIVAEAFSFRTAVQESRPLKGDVSWAQFVRRAKVPELPVVLLEDLGALVGLVLALLAVSLSALTEDPIYDAFGTLGIGILLVCISVVLAVEMKSLLIGEAADPREERAIRDAVAANPLVRELIFLRTQHFGPNELLVTAKVEFDASLTLPELAVAIDQLEGDIRAVVPTARYLYVEPDVKRAAASIQGDRDGSGDAAG